MSHRVRRGLRALAALTLFTSAAAGDVPERVAYVIGANDATLSRVDLDTGEVVIGIATVGATANRIETFPDLSHAVIANSGSDDVTVFDLAAETVVRTVPLPAGANPWTCEVFGSRVFVTGLLADRIWELDPLAGAVVDSAVTGGAPAGMCVAAGKLYVANSGFDFDDYTYEPGSVTVLDLAGLATAATIPVGLNPQECLVAPDGSIHVVCTGNFAGATGAIHVLDPATDAPRDTLAVPAYPGGGAIAPDGTAALNVTTPAFGSEVWVYDAATLAWRHDAGNPLLPSFDFYGNLRVDGAGDILVPDFAADLLLVEDPDAPGATTAHLVGDGPIDLAAVERDGPVSLILSGLSAVNTADGIRLSWSGTPESDLVAFAVERGAAGRDGFTRLVSDLRPARRTDWTDADVQPLVAYTYRVGAVSHAGSIQWLPPLTLVRRPPATGRLAALRARPNPFQDVTTVSFLVPRAGAGTVEVVDVAGRRVLREEIGELSPGTWEWRLDGRRAGSRPLAAGLYFVRLRLGAESAVQRVLRVR